MPSRAYTSFLRDDNCSAWCRLSRCQCPLGLIPHFYTMAIVYDADQHTIVSMPSRAYTSFLLLISLELPGVVSQSVNALSGLYFISTLWRLVIILKCTKKCVNALSGLYFISTESMFSGRDEIIMGVNALSGLYFISTMVMIIMGVIGVILCQCPLGLILHFYGTPSKT